MHLASLLVALISLAPSAACQEEHQESAAVSSLRDSVQRLTRQLMMQQLYVEESTRSTWDSGLKQIRRRSAGPKSYYSETHSGGSIAAIHNHANNIRTVGMGEFTAVLNGVEFRTRHNDYRLKMAASSSALYHATEDLPFPDVPPAVLQKETIEEQITEMREWFKAWKDEDHSVRDYRKYFRPVLVYLEGAWTLDDTLKEPFESDRHFLDAGSWSQLQEQIRFTSVTGSKNFGENIAFLPTTVVQGSNSSSSNSSLQLAQWNYRILAHPVQGHLLPLSALQPLDHLASRLPRGRTFSQHLQSRAARFRVTSPADYQKNSWPLLDQLMYQVPGKDNYVGNLTQELFGQIKSKVSDGSPLNTARYFRSYKVQRRDANGQTSLHNGYADQNLFVAETTQPSVAPVHYPYKCRTQWQRLSGLCTVYTQRVSHAIPLEIIYLTPLHSWNPRKLQYKGDFSTPLGKTVNADGRNGRSAETAYNGTNSKMFYQTPLEFYQGGEVEFDSADTTRLKVWVLNETGSPHEMSSTGVRIHLPNIPGVGVMRTRYPIMPVATEGHPIWKELEALKDIVLNMKEHLRYFPTPPPVSEQVLQENDPQADRQLLVTTSVHDYVKPHEHVVKLTRDQYLAMLRNNQTFVLYTSTSESHYHQLLVDYNELSRRFEYRQCDAGYRCFDGHRVGLVVG